MLSRASVAPSAVSAALPATISAAPAFMIDHVAERPELAFEHARAAPCAFSSGVPPSSASGATGSTPNSIGSIWKARTWPSFSSAT